MRVRWLLEKAADFLEEVIPAIALAAMTTVVSVNVVSRYVFNSPIALANELTVLIAFWTIWLGAARAVAKRGDPSLDYLLRGLKGRARAVVDLFISGFCLATVPVLAWISWFFAIESGVRLESVGTSKTVMWLAMPIGSLLISIRFLQRLVNTSTRWRQGSFDIPLSHLPGDSATSMPQR